MDLSHVRAWDEVVLTGTSHSPAGVRHVGLRGTVATVSYEDEALPGWWVKVWPDDGTVGDGMVWFHQSGVEELEVVQRLRWEEGEKGE